MPCLVYKMTVGRNCVYFAPFVFEVVIMLLKVIKFGRTDEREVGGIEEKQALGAEKILFCDFFKSVVFV